MNAYNARDAERLAELAPPNSSPFADSTGVPIADMSGIPHLGEDDWIGVGDWAQRGWSVEDRFELTRLVMYDSGSVFEVERSNDVLRANGIERLHHSAKVHSSRCSISHLVLYLPSLMEAGSPQCRFFEVFADDLEEGTTQSIRSSPTCARN